MKMQRIELEIRLGELRHRYTVKDDEIQQLNQELAAKKEIKAKCKIQLRELYLNLLQNEAHLM